MNLRKSILALSVVAGIVAAPMTVFAAHTHSWGSPQYFQEILKYSQCFLFFDHKLAGNDTMLIYLFRVTFVAIYTCTIHPFVRHFNRLNFINAYFSTN